MSLRDQALALARQGAAFRREISGETVVWSGNPSLRLCAAVSGPRRTREITEGGFDPEFDFTARVDRCAFPSFAPQLGQTLTVRGVVYRIDEVTDLALAGEWRLGLSVL